MTSADLLVDAFGRIRESVHDTLRGLDVEALTYRPTTKSNSIAWLVWHLTRIQDDHIADVAGTEQIWTSQGWAEGFDLPLEPADTGYGHKPAQVAGVVAEAATLRGYHDAVHQATISFVEGLKDDDLAAVVDTRWDPPVTLAVRLVSVIADDLQHVGQAAYLRGLLTTAR